jgi:mannose-6-phosphate isomerase-like protein (cupin superfamily)/peptidoglycan hydrolase-like protein with peptidoglycan-binding domain
MPIGNLTVGAFGDGVRDIHSRLRQHGFDLPAAEVDRQFFGPGTREALCNFQRKYGVNVTGIVDVPTTVALQGPSVANGGQQRPATASTPPANGSNDATNGAVATPPRPPARPVSTTNGVADYSARDNDARVTFYVLLWKRKGISLEGFDDYWRDVHGPVCARLPAQYQYWQFHVAHNEGGIFPDVEGVDYSSPEEDQFDGIAELTFRSAADRDIWFNSSGILMDDEHNIFSKGIGYVTELGNSTTYVDGIETGDPNGDLDVIKFHVMVRQAPWASTRDFRSYMSDTFAANVVRSSKLLKFRLHLFEPPDVSRPDAAGVVHYEPPEKQYQAAYEIAFRNKLDMELFFASPEYAAAVEGQSRYVQQVSPFPERDAYTFVYNGKMTLTGQRGSRTAELITELGATNQLRKDIHDLVVGAVSHSSAMANGGNGNSNGMLPPSAGNGTMPNMAQIFSPFNRHGKPDFFQTFKKKPVAKVVKPHERQVIETSGDICSFMALGEDTDNAYGFMESLIPPGGGPPPHIQHWNEEGFYIAEGELTFVVDGEEVVLGEGDFVNVPKEVVHSFTNKTNRKARILVIMSPSVEEYYLLAVGHQIADVNSPLPPTTEEDVQKYLTLSPDYGLEYALAEDQEYYQGGTLE